MFESFHEELKIVERDSVCQCGACKTASNLTLKFIAHHGMVQEIKVLQFTKCSGLDLVVAHVAVEIDAPMLEVYQLVIDLDQRTRWLSAIERVDRPATSVCGTSAYSTA